MKKHLATLICVVLCAYVVPGDPIETQNGLNGIKRLKSPIALMFR